MTFMGTAKFMDSSVRVKQLSPVSCGPNCTLTAPGESYVVKKGGAIHNKVWRCSKEFHGARVEHFWVWKSTVTRDQGSR